MKLKRIIIMVVIILSMLSICERVYAKYVFEFTILAVQIDKSYQ